MSITSVMQPPTQRVHGSIAWKILRIGGVILRWFLVFVLTLWAVAALYFDMSRAAALIYCVGIGATVLWMKKGWGACGVLAMGFCIVLVWWLSLQPSSQRSWQPDVAQTAWAQIDGDLVTLHNVRNCIYQTETEYTPQWEVRTVKLSDLREIDIAINYWGSPWIAHPIVSFDFGNDQHLAVSIETRKETGESYSAIRGFFRQYELIYVVGDERDLIRVRTNYRKGEDVYLYRLRAKPEQARQRFLEYLATLNRLNSQPAWYNALTTNCTTAIRTQHTAELRMPFDWRIVLNGKMDEMLYERGALDRTLPFAELKQRAQINERARAADQAPDFSRRIREGL